MVKAVHEIRLSTFHHAKDGIPKPVTTTWAAFVGDLGPSHRTDIATKAKVPAFSPAEFRPGMPRKEDYTVRVWFGVLDLDLITGAQLSQVCDRLEGLDAVLYTTWGHPEAYRSKGLWKVRICIRFSRPAELREWPIVWASMSAFFCGLNDPSMNSANEIYFGPSVPPGSDLALCHFVVFQGGALDIDNLPLQTFGVGPKPSGVGSEKVTRERLERLARRWKAAKDSHKSEMGEVLDRVCKGERFAENGNTDTTIFQLAGDLVKAIPGLDPESCAQHFAQSLQIMISEKGLYPLERVIDKLARAQERRAAEEYAEEMAEASERKQRIRQAFAHLDPTRESSYTEDELGAMAASLDCSREELRKRWLIQRGSLFYVLGPEGVYSPPYSDKDIFNAVLRDLAPADSAGVELWTESASGEPIRKSLPSLMAEYGCVATDYVLDMRAEVASYRAAERLFIEAPCPLRGLAPNYDPDVAGWLEILTGPHHANVLNWIAQVTNLDLTAAVLMLTGAKDTGKSLLAFGLSRLWTVNGPTTLTSALASFNDKLARCPFVFADEQLPKDFRGHDRTEEIRQFVSDRARPLNKKYAPETSIIGAIRLMVAANNESIMAMRAHLSAHDIEAIGDRFYHVPVDPRAAHFLTLCDAGSFISGDRIAKHALWLKYNYPTWRDGRFLIRSTDREFYRGLATLSGIRSAVCQWFAGYLKAPSRVDARGDFGVLIRRGKLYVTPQTVLESWEVYVSNEDAPPLGVLAQAISELSVRRTTLAKPRGLGDAKFREIDTDHLYAWAARTEFSSREEIDAALALDTDTRILQRGAPPKA